MDNCIFCNSSLNLIYLSQNVVQLDTSEQIEFNEIVRELFNKKIKNYGDALICDTCKDLLVDFYVFSSNVRNNKNFMGLTEEEEEDIPMEVIFDDNLTESCCEEEQMIVEEPKKLSKFSCERCCFQFITQAHWSAHQNGHSLFDALAPHMLFFRCELCPAIFCDNPSLIVHLNHHENESELLEVPSKGFFLKYGHYQKLLESKKYEVYSDDSPKCGHCLKQFNNDEKLFNHLLVFHATILVCPIDLREFTNNNQAFSIHMRKNHPELFPNASYRCSLCSAEFDSYSDKILHMKTCSEKKYKCTHCDLSFIRKCYLVKHLKLVSGESQVICQLCQKICRDKEDYQIHSRSHSNDKIFQCSLCPKSYKTASARSAHLQTHYEVFTCNFCKNDFKSKRTLVKHVKIKHNKFKIE